MVTRKRGAFDGAHDMLLSAAERFSRANRRRLGAPGLRTFLNIAELWGLSEEERLLILGMPSRSTYRKWTNAVRECRDIMLNVDTLMRISIVLGIHQSLGVLQSDEREGVAWLRTPNKVPLFGGRPPMALINSGTQDGLMCVRRFLDAACGGLYMTPNEIDMAFSAYQDGDIALI